jgi:hypothetical protein
VIQSGELGLELGLGRTFQALAFTHRFRGFPQRALAEARIQDFANEERTQYAD